METLTSRSFYSSSAKVPVIVIRNDDAQVLQVVDYLRTPYRVLSESYTPNSDTARRRIERDLDIPVTRELQVDIDRKKLNGLSVWKPFQHSKRWWDSSAATSKKLTRLQGSMSPSNYGASVFMERESDITLDGVFGEDAEPTVDLPVWFDPDSDTEEWITPPSELDSLITRSLSRLVPKVKNQVQLLNTLYELKDVKSLGHTIARIKELGRALKSKGVVGSLRAIAVSGADIFLQMRFNINPLIRDIEGIYHALVDSLGPLRRMMQFDGTPQTTRFRCLVDEDDELINDQLSGYFNGVFDPDLFYYEQAEVRLPSGVNRFFSVNREVYTSPSHFYAQMRFVARWTESQHRYAEQLALIDALGLSFNPKHVWDAIPWSFVIDWVFKVGDFLDQFSKGALEPVLDVLDYSWTIRRERSVKLALVIDQDTLPPGSPLLPESYVVEYPTFWETAYRRQPVPLSSLKSTLVLSGISSTELTLAAALLVTRKRKLRKPKTESKRRGRIKTRLRRQNSPLHRVISK